MLAAAHRSSMCVLGGAVREPGMPILAIISMDQKKQIGVEGSPSIATIVPCSEEMS